MMLWVGEKAARKNLFHVKNVVFALFVVLALFAKTSAQEARKVRLAYAQKQISAPVNVAAVTDYTLLDQVLAGK
jgi:hypothetical protein